MFDGSKHIETSEATWAAAETTPRWTIVHAELAGIARKRAALDADEARWLREAEQLQIWHPFGMVSMLDYLERVAGYAPRTAQERLRVARSLGDLPELTEALARGELPFSAIKELSRIATPTTEASWRQAARGMNLRQIEDLVSGHKPGDRPDDPKDEQARLYDWTFRELSAATFALMRQARHLLDEEHGTRMTDDEIVAAMAATIVQGTPTGEATGRARNQISYTVCRSCDRAWQTGGGRQVPVDAATIEQARCDAQHVGDLDGSRPARATQDIPPAIARFVWNRDNHVCQTPGCRSSRGLEIHHIVARADGGTHDPSNLTLRCFACHRAHHQGLLVISGIAPDRLVTTRANDPSTIGPNERSTVEPHERSMIEPNERSTIEPDVSRSDVVPTTTAATTPTASKPSLVAPTRPAPTNDKWAIAVARTEAISGLTTMGWKRHIAAKAVDEALAACARVPTTAELLTAAVRRCPRPSSS